MDCMQGMKEFPDKYFDLAIVDVPYGIGESGGKNKSRGKLAKPTDYKDYIGNDSKAPNKDYLGNYSEYQKTKLYGVQIIL